MANIIDDINNLLNKTSEILQQYDEQKTSGNEFNVLDICRVGTIETNHTEIIAELLNPNGKHGFGINSLKAFFRQCNLDELANCCDGCDVETEVRIEGRRPDIIIRNENLCVVIENKTNTTDHYMQLKDYKVWLQKQNAKHKYLLYLTYNGSDATDENIKPEEYYKISYKNTICNWLRECACLNNQVASLFCKQYANYITNFILGNRNMEINDKLKAIIDCKEKMIAAEKIASVISNLKNEKFIALFNNWANQEHQDGILVELTSAQTNDGIKISHNNENKNELVFGFSFDSSNFRNFYYGFTWKDGKAKNIDDVKNAYSPQEGWSQSEWWPYWKYFQDDFRHPGDNLDFLFDEQKTKTLHNAMTNAFKEMKDLLENITSKQ